MYSEALKISPAQNTILCPLNGHFPMCGLSPIDRRHHQEEPRSAGKMFPLVVHCSADPNEDCVEKLCSFALT